MTRIPAKILAIIVGVGVGINISPSLPTTQAQNLAQTTPTEFTKSHKTSPIIPFEKSPTLFPLLPTTPLQYNGNSYFEADSNLGLWRHQNHEPPLWSDPLRLRYNKTTHSATKPAFPQARNKIQVKHFDKKGKLLQEKTFESGQTRKDEAIHPFPHNYLLTHAENRAMRDFQNLQPGDKILIQGLYPPCNWCKTAMVKKAKETQATITYQWPAGIKQKMANKKDYFYQKGTFLAKPHQKK